MDYSKIRVFEQVTVLPIVTVLEKKKDKKYITEIFEPLNGDFIKINSTSQEIWLDNDLNIININLSKVDLQLRSKIEVDCQSLDKFAQIKFGIKLYETGKGKPPQKPNFAKEKIYEADNKVDETYRPYLEGKDINPYVIEYKNRWLKYGENLAAPRDPNLFKGKRILIRRIVGKTLISAYTDENYVTSQLLQIVKPTIQEDTKFLLGVLNSKLIAFYFRKKYNRQDKTFPEIRIYELCSLPIKNIIASNKPIQIDIVKFVEKLLRFKEEQQSLKLQSKINQIQSKIEIYENKINQLVYQLYELREEEIKIVEGKK